MFFLKLFGKELLIIFSPPYHSHKLSSSQGLSRLLGKRLLSTHRHCALTGRHCASAVSTGGQSRRPQGGAMGGAMFSGLPPFFAQPPIGLCPHTLFC